MNVEQNRYTNTDSARILRSRMTAFVHYLPCKIETSTGKSEHQNVVSFLLWRFAIAYRSNGICNNVMSEMNSIGIQLEALQLKQVKYKTLYLITTLNLIRSR